MMVDDAMSGQRVIGVVQPASAGEEESPSGKDVGLKRVGCVGRITSYQELDDGAAGHDADRWRASRWSPRRRRPSPTAR